MYRIWTANEFSRMDGDCHHWVSLAPCGFREDFRGKVTVPMAANVDIVVPMARDLPSSSVIL